MIGPHVRRGGPAAVQLADAEAERFSRNWSSNKAETLLTSGRSWRSPALVTICWGMMKDVEGTGGGEAGACHC